MINKRILNKEMEQKDIQALGLIMMELMEPDTSMLNPETIILKDPEKWSKQTGIKAFLAAIETASLDSLRSVCVYDFLFLYELTLRQNVFLPTKPVPQCLNPHILVAQVSTRSPGEIFM